MKRQENPELEQAQIEYNAALRELRKQQRMASRGFGSRAQIIVAIKAEEKARKNLADFRD